ncbi:Protein CBG25744 [Caenorhabditis briggsae]|uniref:Protein CBG25744 n=2 Tax=Caenorhabditis briggsae TaxID=6238 RepID=B6IHR5_CAEBR|nr:Protein CBG25744 [Caenorhabditis briggsae]ULT85151.1 hypothetical protein L3Y34_013699 [Caenorhabditis briggsae]CAR99445.1 Protein CBG25744 [Caenorhabditis briggsae]
MKPSISTWTLIFHLFIFANVIFPTNGDVDVNALFNCQDKPKKHQTVAEREAELEAAFTNLEDEGFRYPAEIEREARLLMKQLHLQQCSHLGIVNLLLRNDLSAINQLHYMRIMEGSKSQDKINFVPQDYGKSRKRPTIQVDIPSLENDLSHQPTETVSAHSESSDELSPYSTQNSLDPHSKTSEEKVDVSISSDPVQNESMSTVYSIIGLVISSLCVFILVATTAYFAFKATKKAKYAIEMV